MSGISIAVAAAVIGVIGIAIGMMLLTASDKFHVEVDEREAKVRELLPGNNCGACGYPGCDGLAAAIAAGEAPANACPVCSADAITAISDIMGVEAEISEKKVAFIKCAGTCEKAGEKYLYDGITDCISAAVAPGGGSKACTYGCLGLGSCASVCTENAIRIVDGIAVVDESLCIGCGSCAKVCPKHVIDMVPVSAQVRVQCNSHDKGKDVKSVCQTGCIGCGICMKLCPEKAITVTDALASIDYAKCTNCGTCQAKCPVKIIK